MPTSERLLSATLIQNFSIKELEEIGKVYPGSKLTEQITFPIAVYEIIYATTYQGNKISASGLLYIPEAITNPLPILSLQHGTIFLKSEAPTLSIGYAGGELVSSAGYIVIQSDYLGYGISENVFHPYYDKAHAASSVIDLIKASLELLSSKDIQYNDALFLLGFSEGGYTTLATQQQLEKHNNTGLQLKAVAAGAGGYDLFAFLGEFTTGSTTHIQPAYIVFLLLAYEKLYNWNKGLEHYFSPEFSKIIPELFSGNYTSAYINHELSGNLSNLFNPEFYLNLTGTGEMELKKALLINTLSDWCPQTPLRLFHGTADEVIPFNNSEITYEKMMSRGAPNVKLMSIPNGNHFTSKVPMIGASLTWFEKLL